MATGEIIGVASVQIEVERTNIFQKLLNSQDSIFIFAIIIIALVFLFFIISRLGHLRRLKEKIPVHKISRRYRKGHKRHR